MKVQGVCGHMVSVLVFESFSLWSIVYRTQEGSSSPSWGHRDDFSAALWEGRMKPAICHKEDVSASQTKIKCVIFHTQNMYATDEYLYKMLISSSLRFQECMSTVLHKIIF